MRLVLVKEFIETQFGEKSQPSERTVKNWMKKDDFPFAVVAVGGREYIDVDSPEINKQTDGSNQLLQRILNHGSETA